MIAIAPVIKVSQAAIVGVGAMRPLLARAEGEIVDRPLVTLTLGCDHRMLYGAHAARVPLDDPDDARSATPACSVTSLMHRNRLGSGRRCRGHPGGAARDEDRVLEREEVVGGHTPPSACTWLRRS
jgi:hypothetical protein